MNLQVNSTDSSRHTFTLGSSIVDGIDKLIDSAPSRDIVNITSNSTGGVAVSSWDKAQFTGTNNGVLTLNANKGGVTIPGSVDFSAAAGSGGSGGSLRINSSGNISVNRTASFKATGDGTGSGGSFIFSSNQGSINTAGPVTFDVSGAGGGGFVQLASNNDLNLSDTTINANGGGGLIVVQSNGALNLTGNQFIATADANGNGGGSINIDVNTFNAGHATVLLSASDPTASGGAGSVNINASTMNIGNAAFTITANSRQGSGNNSNITVGAMNSGGAPIIVNVDGGQNGGDINLSLGSYNGRSHMSLSANMVAGNPGNGSSGGLIAINGTNSSTSLSIGNGAGQISAVATGASSDATSNDGGAVRINVGGNLTVNSATIDVHTFATNGSGGQVELQAGTGGQGTLSINGNIDASGTGAGNGGLIAISAPKIVSTAARTNVISASGGSTGNGGSILMQSTDPNGSLTIGRGAGAFVLSATGGSVGSGSGNGGSLEVDSAGNLAVLAGGTLRTAPLGTNGDGGSVSLHAGTSGAGTLMMNANINVNGKGTGSGGDATLLAPDILLPNVLVITANGGHNNGAGGNIDVETTAGRLNLGQERISADGNGTGNGGTITLNASQLNLSESTVLANAGVLGGNGGTVNIKYNSATVLNIDGIVSASGPAGIAGEVHISNESPTAPLVVSLTGVISTQSATGTATTFFGDRTQPAKDVIVFLAPGGRFHDIHGRTGMIDSDVNAFGSFISFTATVPKSVLTVDKIDSVNGGRVVLNLATEGSSINLVSNSSYVKSSGNITIFTSKLMNNGLIQSDGTDGIVINNTNPLRDLQVLSPAGTGVLSASGGVHLQSTQGVDLIQGQIIGTLSGRSTGAPANDFSVTVFQGSLRVGDVFALPGSIKITLDDLVSATSLMTLEQAAILNAVNGSIKLQVTNPDGRIILREGSVLRSVTDTSPVVAGIKLLVGNDSAISQVVSPAPLGVKVTVQDATGGPRVQHGHFFLTPNSLSFDNFEFPGQNVDIFAGGTKIQIGSEIAAPRIFAEGGVVIESGVANLVPIACVDGSATSDITWKSHDRFKTLVARSSLGGIDCLIVAHQRARFQVQDLTLDVLPNTVFGIEATIGKLTVFVLADKRADSMRISTGGSQFNLSTGRYAHFSQVSGKGGRLQMEQVACRSTRECQAGRNYVALGEFSHVSAFEKLLTLRRLTLASDPRSRRILNYVLKAAACLSIVTEAHGPFFKRSNQNSAI